MIFFTVQYAAIEQCCTEAYIYIIIFFLSIHISRLHTPSGILFFLRIYIYIQIITTSYNQQLQQRLFCVYTTEPGCLSISTSYFFAQQIKQQTSYSTTRPTLSIKKILFGLKDTYVDIYIVCQKRAIYIKKKDRSKERERGTKIHIQKTKTSERRWYD